MNKKNTEKRHFKRRVLERYDITLTDNDYDYLCSRVRNNDKTIVKFLTKQTNRVSIQLISFKNKKIVCAYDKVRKALITALPAECCDVKNLFYYSMEIEAD
jgi:hypothetical protein